MKHRDQILQLSREGKSRSEIQSILGCAKSTISFHLSQGQKEQVRKRKAKSREHPFARKLERFKSRAKIVPNTPTQLSKWIKVLTVKIRSFHRDRKSNTMSEPSFTVQDVIRKFGETPTCYLTGTPLDIYDPRSYAFDHIVPTSRGGTNTIDNLGLCTKQANLAKSDMTPAEFVELCKMVVKYSNK